jgi:engulfment/cell motility protein 1
LESAVTSGVSYSQVDKEVTLPVLVTHVQNPDSRVQQSALALINALFSKADVMKRKTFAATLTSRKYRDIVLQNVVSFLYKIGILRTLIVCSLFVTTRYF